MRATGFACRFYASALETEWRFGESEAYLQELGAPVDTSAWYGKEVIIPNYIQGTSNCMVATSHYHVCCLIMCEEILRAIEDDSVERSPPVMLASLPDQWRDSVCAAIFWTPSGTVTMSHSASCGKNWASPG